MAVDPFLTDWGRVRPDYPRSAIEGRFVGVMRLKVEDRGFELIPQGSRCIRRWDIHEVIVTDEAATPSARVGRCAYLGFVEFASGGVVLEGDDVRVGNAQIGRVAGFDETHLPNHLNIVLRGDVFASGVERGFTLGELITFVPVFSA